MFGAVWHRLRSLGVVKHSIAHIDNSDLFKYSPYKTLSREQKEGIVLIINAILNDDFQNVVIEGGAGTGKTIMATYLFKLMHTPIEEFNFRSEENTSELQSPMRISCAVFCLKIKTIHYTIKVQV